LSAAEDSIAPERRGPAQAVVLDTREGGIGVARKTR
jgi:hypothetical protein